jgi:hypothetical protein
MVNGQKKQRMPQGQAGASLPLEDYDSLSIEEIVNKSMELSSEEIEELCHYERANENRKNLVRHFQRRIGASVTTSGTGREDPPPGEERPGRRRTTVSSAAREEPPPGEERPERRAP